MKEKLKEILNTDWKWGGLGKQSRTVISLIGLFFSPLFLLLNLIGNYVDNRKRKNKRDLKSFFKDNKKWTMCSASITFVYMLLFDLLKNSPSGQNSSPLDFLLVYALVAVFLAFILSDPTTTIGGFALGGGPAYVSPKKKDDGPDYKKMYEAEKSKSKTSPATQNTPQGRNLYHKHKQYGDRGDYKNCTFTVYTVDGQEITLKGVFWNPTGDGFTYIDYLGVERTYRFN